MNYFATTDELVNAFGDIESEGFYSKVNLTDTAVGFSVKKHYPDNIRFNPAISQGSNAPDHIAVLWVVYLPPKPTTEKKHRKIVPLRIRISVMSQYLANHYDYNYLDVEGGCPSKESLEASRKSPNPIELSFEKEFFYDHENNGFVDSAGKRITGAEVLQRVFEAHCDTVHFFKGLKLRLKLAWQAKTIGILSLSTQVLISLLKFAFGRTIETNDVMAGLYEPYTRKSFKKLDQDSINLLGYKASQHVIILFCALAILLSIYKYNHSCSLEYITWLQDKEFLSVAHGIFAIWLIDVVVPYCLFWLTNITIIIKKKLAFMKFSAK